MLNEEHNVIAIIPMKRLSDGKSRLARSLTPEQRAELTLGMLRRVLLALAAASIDMIWVVGGDQRVRNVARNHDAVWWEDMGRNLNDTLGKAMDLVFSRNKAALYVAGDLPFIKPSDVHSMLQASRGFGNVTLGPAAGMAGPTPYWCPTAFPFGRHWGGTASASTWPKPPNSRHRWQSHTARGSGTTWILSTTWKLSNTWNPVCWKDWPQVSGPSH